MTANGSLWLYAQVFSGANMDRTLVECLIPFAGAMEAKELIDRWFFVRYWQGGPHIRLRCRGTGDLPNIEFSSALLASVTAYFEHTNNGDQTAAPWSVNFEKYEPELDRYGGSAAMTLAEDQFYYSSQIVAKLLPKCIANEAARPAGALQLLFIQLLASEFTLAQCELFAKCLITQFASFVPADGFEQILRACEAKFQKRQNALVDTLGRLHQSFENPQRAEIRPVSSSSAIQSWFNWCQNFYRNLMDLASQGELYPQRSIQNDAALLPAFRTVNQILDNPWMRFYESFDHRTKEAASILFSQVHMTNNRIGVSTIEEPYLGFLLYRTIQTIRLQLQR